MPTDRPVDVLVIGGGHAGAEAALAAAPECDIFIGTAAVADYTPVSVADRKIKKQQPEMTLALRRTEDILSRISAHEHRPFSVGFAAETNDVVDYARQKLLS